MKPGDGSLRVQQFPAIRITSLVIRFPGSTFLFKASPMSICESTWLCNPSAEQVRCKPNLDDRTAHAGSGLFLVHDRRRGVQSRTEWWAPYLVRPVKFLYHLTVMRFRRRCVTVCDTLGSAWNPGMQASYVHTEAPALQSVSGAVRSWLPRIAQKPILIYTQEPTPPPFFGYRQAGFTRGRYTSNYVNKLRAICLTFRVFRPVLTT